MSEKIPVLVTGVGGGGTGHELVKTLRLAGRYHIVGVDMNASSLGLCDVDEAFLVPPSSSPDYINVIRDICKSKKIKALFAGSEPELKIISQHRNIFADINVLVMANTPEVIDRGLDKWNTMSYLKDHGFTVPRSQLLFKVDEIPSDFPLPAVIKPSVGGGGSTNTFLVQDLAEFDYACRYLVGLGKVVLIQEYVGTPQDEYTVGVLSTFNGNFLGSIALRRNILSGLSNRFKVPNRTNRKDLSPLLAISSGVSQGTIEDFPEIRKECETIASEFGSKGPINIQGRWVNGKWYTFEINPRFSGTSFVRALVGFNEADILIRYHILGEQITTPISYKYGQVIRGLREQFLDDSVIREQWTPGS